MGKAAVGALAAGTVGSVAFTLYAGLRIGAPRVLLWLFAAWVAGPFAVFAVGLVLSKRASPPMQRRYSGSVVAVSLLSLLVYGMTALGAARPGTRIFVLVAPLSLLVVGIAAATAALTRR